MSRWVRAAGVVVTFVILAISLGIGCRSAASVILDLPEPEAADAKAADRNPTVAPTRVMRETARVPPPIETTLDPDSALALLPRDSAGGVDWAAAVRRRIVDPQRSLPGQRPGTAPGFGYDFYFGGLETYFPHSTHSAWMDCVSCHPTIYRTRGHETSMEEINRGASCGICHRSVAFGAEVCERCHPAMGMPGGRMEPSLGMALVLQRDTTGENARAMGSLPPSVFPHWLHRARYTCSVCHPQPFAMEAGSTQVTMNEIQVGRSCGACHDGSAAFGVMECNRCHAEPATAAAESE